MLTDQERQKAIHVLTKTRQTLLDAVDGVTESQARWKPAPDRWCILEYVEHLAVSDDGPSDQAESASANNLPELKQKMNAVNARIRFVRLRFPVA